MDDLSPAAQAVFNAAWTCPIVLGDHPTTRSRQIAAALRAVADQVSPKEWSTIEAYNQYDQGVAAAHVKHRNKILAIANELCGDTTAPTETP